jgi:hypothetical protein
MTAIEEKGLSVAQIRALKAEVMKLPQPDVLRLPMSFVDCQVPPTAEGLVLVLQTTLALRRAGFKTRMIEREVKGFPLLSVVYHNPRPSRKVRLAGFNNAR